MKKIITSVLVFFACLCGMHAQTPDSMISEGWTCIGNPECYEIKYSHDGEEIGHIHDGNGVWSYSYSLWVKQVGAKEYYSILMKIDKYSRGVDYSKYMVKLKNHCVYISNRGSGGAFPREYHLRTFNAEFDSEGTIYVFDF